MKGGLDRQLATIVCRIIWTLSVCWKLDFLPGANFHFLFSLSPRSAK
jgi:hypothetical protein